MRIAVIPARGGSKRIPRKNVKPFCGKPMIAWPIAAAIQSGCFERVIVSTDDTEIAATARTWGAEVPFLRPGDLAGDFASTNDVMDHAVRWCQRHGISPSHVCCIYPTSPLLDSTQLARGLALLKRSTAEYVFPVTAYASPIQRAIRIKENGTGEMFEPKNSGLRSQELECAYHDAGSFYWGTAVAWLSRRSVFDSRFIPLILPRTEVIDINVPEDWVHAERLWEVSQCEKAAASLADRCAHSGTQEKSEPASRYAIGTAQFGLDYGIANHKGRVKSSDVVQILSEAAIHGVNTLDTAVAYGDSEQVLGSAGIGGWDVITKIPAVPDTCEDVTGWVVSQISASMERLRVTQLSAILLHRPNQVHGTRGKQLLAALEHVRHGGLVRKLGVSIYAPSELGPLLNVMDFEIVQAPLNILDRRLLDSGWLKRLKKLGVEVHARSVFLQGLLLLSATERPEKFQRWQYIWLEWERWMRATGLNPLEACLRYVCSLQDVDKAVVGVDNVDQLRAILASPVGGLESLPAWPAQIDPELLSPDRWGDL